MERDLTVGGVGAQLARFAAPFLLSNLLQSSYGLVDMAVVGRFVGERGLAAVASATTLCYLITSLCMGLTIGGTVVIAQRKGARDEEGQRQAAASLLAVSGASALILTAAGLAVYEPLLAAMGLPPEAMPQARGYTAICLSGTIFVFGYNAVCSIMRGLGDSESPLAYVALSSILNAGLDFLFVGGLGMGTAGSALATVVSQALSFALAFARLRKGSSRGFSLAGARPSAGCCTAILKIGLPAALQSAALNLSYLLVTAMLNAYGVGVAAAAGLGLKINGFAVMPCWAVGQAVTAMAGQNIGSGDVQRAAKVARTGAALGVAATAISVAAVQAFVGPIVGLFTEEPSLVSGGVEYLRICCSANCLVYAVMYVLDCFATGVGDSLFAMTNALLHSVVVRLALSLLLSATFGLGYLGVYWAEMACPLPSFVAGLIYFGLGRWKGRRLAERV